MTSASELARTPLYDWHIEHGGRMVDFAGWAMPVQYTSIAGEHTATRSAAGLFDISHMGRLRLSGPEAAKFLDGVVTRRVTDMRPGQIRYSFVCNDQGGILDDVLVYRVADDPSAGELATSFQVVANACNRAKIVDWLSRRVAGYNARVDDATVTTAMLAVQGPQAIRLLDSLLDHDLTTMRYYTSVDTQLGGRPVFVSRTGYTGEDGCEVICSPDDALSIWQQILEAGEEIGVQPIGLGARDTLRLEAAMPLYGHELTEQINPIQAGLSFAVNFDEREFVGRAALVQCAGDAHQRVRIGLELDGRRLPRQGCTVLHGDEAVGEVTSGTYSPTFQRPIAMAYVRPTAQAPGTRLAIEIRGTAYAAVVVPLPFYERGQRR